MEKEEREMGDKFIIFRPYMISIESNKKFHYKGREFQRKLQKLFGMKVPYVKTNRKKGVIIFNEETVDKDKLEVIMGQTHKLDHHEFTLKKETK